MHPLMLDNQLLNRFKPKSTLQLNDFILFISLILLCVPTSSKLCSDVITDDFNSPIFGTHTHVSNSVFFKTENGLNILYPERIAYKFEEDETGVNTINCIGTSGCNKLCNSFPSECNGDLSFCNYSTCNHNSDCYCRIGKAKSNTYITYNHIEEKVVATEPILISNCYDLNLIKKRYINQVNYTSPNCEIYSIIKDNNLLQLSVVPTSSTGFFKVYYLGETKIIQNSGTFSLFSIPLAWSQTSGDITTEFISNEMYCYGSQEIIAKTTCSMIDCTFCSDVYHNYKCLPPSNRDFLFWCIFIVLILAIIFFPLWGYFLYTIMLGIFGCCCGCVKYSGKLHKTRIMKNLYFNLHGKAKSTKKYFEVDDDIESRSKEYNDDKIIEDIHTTAIIDEGIKKETHKRRLVGYRAGLPIYESVAIFCFILIMVPPTFSACTEGVSIQSGQTLCTANGNQVSCTEHFNIFATVPTTGAQYCFSLKSNDTTILTGYVQHLGVIAHLNTISQYFTSPWEGGSQSAHACPLDSHCVSGSCHGISLQRDSYGALSAPELSLYPGVTICHDSCQCVTCGGCFLCDPSCLHSGYWIKPTGKIYQIYKIDSIDYRPQILLHLEGPNYYEHRIIVPTVNPIVINDFSIEMVGLFTPPQLSLSDISISHDLMDDIWAFTHAAQLNNPGFGLMGDIQANSAAILGNVPTNFKIGSIVELIEGELSDTYIFKAPGVTTTVGSGFYHLLPYTYGGNLWYHNQSNIVTNITNAPSIAVAIHTPNGYTFSQTASVVCPTFVHAGNVSGCYNCPSGAKLTIHAKSTCSSGIVDVSVDDDDIVVFTKSLVLDLDYKDFVVTFSTNKEVNKFKLTLSSSFSSFTQEFTFTAVFVPNVIIGNDTSTSNTTTLPSTGFEGFLEDLKEFSTGGVGIFTWVIIALAVVAVFMFVLPITRTLIMNCIKPSKID